MDTTAKPILATTSLSFLLHGVVFAGLLLVYGQTLTRNEGVGRGIEVQLISSVLVSDQQEVDVARKQVMVAQPTSENLIHAAESTATENILTLADSAKATFVTESEVKALIGKTLIDKNGAEQQYEIKQHKIQQHKIKRHQLSADDSEYVASVQHSTNASQKQHSILELLHNSISNNKEYPYLARRQRREGVATVSFVLYPDGTIEDTHLVVSSHATVLDRAALAAVKKIEPFAAAQDYLEQSKKFQIDIEFELL